ncbi:hypothetical protein Cgig2_007739 [Carnegiea gigantea]|uniref:Uncharacterized protein n=1 Tax=Carnegiea gigantea TaxID=171969 RepID=A0A9Q1K9J1_9CARY|nr:hypothetical protein Cgig2_007739 [Carnegiea gigantea]
MGGAEALEVYFWRLYLKGISWTIGLGCGEEVEAIRREGLIKFPDPPVGEGSVDCVSSKDLRPSLNWSLELGWTVPMPQSPQLDTGKSTILPSLKGSQIGHLRARLIKPLEQGMMGHRTVFCLESGRMLHSYICGATHEPIVLASIVMFKSTMSSSERPSHLVMNLVASLVRAVLMTLEILNEKGNHLPFPTEVSSQLALEMTDGILGPVPKSLVVAADDGRQNKKAESGSSLEPDELGSSEKSTSSFQCRPKDLLKQSEDVFMKDMQQTQSVDMESSRGDAGFGNPRSADSLSSVYVGEVSAGILGTIPAEERSHENGFQDKLLINETSPLTSTFCDGMEGKVMDLEELLCRVKWLRQILKSGISSNLQGPTWKFSNE